MKLQKTGNKESIFLELTAYLKNKNLCIQNIDKLRPWGGFFVIEENDADKFIKEYFPNYTREKLTRAGKLSPKILVVAPNKRLSWQYHNRRAEIWKLIAGEAAVITSDTDEENAQKSLSIGNIVELKQGERHRLVGTNNWGVIAEIWQHTDETNPSNEDDIIRVQDDFGR